MGALHKDQGALHPLLLGCETIHKAVAWQLMDCSGFLHNLPLSFLGLVASSLIPLSLAFCTYPHANGSMAFQFLCTTVIGSETNIRSRCNSITTKTPAPIPSSGWTWKAWLKFVSSHTPIWSKCQPQHRELLYSLVLKELFTNVNKRTFVLSQADGQLTRMRFLLRKWANG